MQAVMEPAVLPEPELGCLRHATAVRAVLEALGKKADPGDDRTEGKRFHDALQLAWSFICVP
jgi:hypothetical protein